MGRSNEKPKEGEMVAAQDVASRASADLFFLQGFNLAQQARVATDDRSQIGDVDDPGDSKGCKQVWVSAHLTLPRGSKSDSRA